MLKHIAVAMLGAAVSLTAVADEQITEEGIEDRILEALGQARPELEFSDVRPAPIDGLYQVQVSGGPLLYVTPEADKMIAGDIFSIDRGGFSRLEDPEVVARRQELVDSLKDANTINFAPEGETKAVVYVFTDVDCGFCRRLHTQINEYRDGGETKPGYNDFGIEIRYLAYPRAGANSPSADKLETAWCADDQQATMDRLKNMQDVEHVACDNNPVAEHYKIGGDVGVSGTPALLMPDGKMQAGYLPPENLAQALGL